MKISGKSVKPVQGIILSLLLIFSYVAPAGLWAADSQPEAQATININTADAELIAETVKGVGIRKANAIVAYRQKHGDFVSVDELVKVKGIAEKTIDKNRTRLSVD
jgi:competence protein ComEA